MRMPFGAFVLALVMAILAGCRQSVSVEEGMASFYAESLHGQRTASGETYNERTLTAAHRTLAFDTRVKVTNLENGRSVWVRINDRGPHVEGRILDLSMAAAHKLKMSDDGTARVRIEIYD